MTVLFLLIALFLSCVAGVLYFAPQLKILNIVHYASTEQAIRINRYAAARLLLPVIVFLACAWIVEMRPELAVPLLFPSIIAVLGAVVWIAAGVTRLAS